MARQVNHDGIYYEGSLRGGRVTSDYNGNLDGLGKVYYDSASNYFAMHLGAGKVFDLGKGNTLDGYLKYFYSHQASDDTTIHIAAAVYSSAQPGHSDNKIYGTAKKEMPLSQSLSFYKSLVLKTQNLWY